MRRGRREEGAGTAVGTIVRLAAALRAQSSRAARTAVTRPALCLPATLGACCVPFPWQFKKALHEIDRILKPDGVYILMSHSAPVLEGREGSPKLARGGLPLLTTRLGHAHNPPLRCHEQDVIIPFMDSTDDEADVEDFYSWEVEAHQIAKPTIDRNKIPVSGGTSAAGAARSHEDMRAWSCALGIGASLLFAPLIPPSSRGSLS